MSVIISSRFRTNFSTGFENGELVVKYRHLCSPALTKSRTAIGAWMGNCPLSDNSRWCCFYATHQ
ncbi:hypothetical protein K450DRAFT_237536 [Umbelopsis ramanniana AG]|uniref:Uncharacterized protein n=1 Tax=Umbelopsis ramanniana AG TaxID=1314678 RepID=A0AAD5ECN4_UMBRA|nr:uncharacterized protein K450DRAFT_237536 [Umbelopsis ramanniana AG]KAI8580541.1 hypothetical protein K450DRAFT_237536 [Umbelopsis ramanniana AG]